MWRGVVAPVGMGGGMCLSAVPCTDVSNFNDGVYVIRLAL